MNGRFLFLGSLIGLLFACAERPAEVPLVYYHSFPKDTTVMLQEIPRQPSFYPLTMFMGDGRVLVRSNSLPGEGSAFYVYKYPEMTLLTGFGEKLECRSFWPLDENRFVQVRSDSLYTYRWVTGDSLKQESASFFGKYFSDNQEIASLSDDLYVYSNSCEQSGMCEYFIRDIKRNLVHPIGQLVESAERFKSVYELKAAYGKGIKVRPDRMYTLIYYARIRRFRIYDTEGTLLHDVFLDCSSCSKVVDADRRRWGNYIREAYVTNKYIYLLAYGEGSSGHDMAPCDLLVTTWDGSPVARYRLNQFISSFFIEESMGRFYGINPGNDQCFYSFNLL